LTLTENDLKLTVIVGAFAIKRLQNAPRKVSESKIFPKCNTFRTC